MIPVDDHPDHEPRPDYETMYELAVLEIGDPGVMHANWTTMVPRFYELFKVWKSDESYVPARPHSTGPAAWLQYVLWYERERRRLEQEDLFRGAGPALTPEG